jgi:uncharacterized protein YutE (UPF0331/DUF86 family)
MPQKRKKQHTGETVDQARVHLKRAQTQSDDARVAWYPPTNIAACVTNCFYAYEAAVVAAAIAVGEPWLEDHREKQKLAKKLADEGHLSSDISDLLYRLNGLRMDASYSEIDEEIEEELEDLLNDLESFLSEVNELLPK